MGVVKPHEVVAMEIRRFCNGRDSEFGIFATVRSGTEFRVRVEMQNDKTLDAARESMMGFLALIEEAAN